MHMSVRVVDLSHFPITCGSPAAIEPVDYKDWDIEFVVSLDDALWADHSYEATRICRHIPNPYRGKGKPIDMSVVDMGEVRKTALMIVVLSEIGGVFFHCRKGKDRTGIVKAEVEHLLSQLMEASACE
jgi:protein tyrosine/serine phosphatase